MKNIKTVPSLMDSEDIPCGADDTFYEETLMPKLKEVAKLCTDKGWEFQGIVAVNDGDINRLSTVHSYYCGDFKLITPAKLECIRLDLHQESRKNR